MPKEDHKVGDSVKVGECVGSRLCGRQAVIVAGPHKVHGVSGIYTVQSEDGVQEDVHGSRLSGGDMKPFKQSVEDAMFTAMSRGRAAVEKLIQQAVRREREECALIADHYEDLHTGEGDAAINIARAIRMRG